MRRIIVGEKAGCCFGVKRALEIAEKTRKDRREPVYTLGPLIHNPRVIAELKSRKIEPVGEISEAEPGGIIIIRSHGVGPRTLEAAKERGLIVVDATCPFVKQEQNLAQNLSRDGYEVVVVGDKDHAEVRAVVESVPGKVSVIGAGDLPELENRALSQRIGVVCQTTQSQENLNKVVTALLPLVKEVKIYNTICNATAQRQSEVYALAQKVDLLLVVGGKNSANTRHLAEIGASFVPTYHIEGVDELKLHWFTGKETIGVTAGASTPQSQIAEVVDWLEENFQEELEWTKKND